VFVEQGITFLVGAIFGSGLLVAGMVRRSNILGFLGLGGGPLFPLVSHWLADCHCRR
jgi:hypothetical protein